MTSILLSRLRDLYHPDWLFNYYKTHDPYKYEPVDFFENEERVNIEDYDARRVRFFLDQLANGKAFDPIKVVAYWNDSVEVYDGRHRYIAAVIFGLEYIATEISGEDKLIEWLRGMN